MGAMTFEDFGSLEDCPDTGTDPEEFKPPFVIAQLDGIWYALGWLGDHIFGGGSGKMLIFYAEGFDPADGPVANQLSCPVDYVFDEDHHLAVGPFSDYWFSGSPHNISSINEETNEATSSGLDADEFPVGAHINIYNATRNNGRFTVLSSSGTVVEVAEKLHSTFSEQALVSVDYDNDIFIIEGNFTNEIRKYGTIRAHEDGYTPFIVMDKWFADDLTYIKVQGDIYTADWTGVEGYLGTLVGRSTVGGSNAWAGAIGTGGTLEILGF
jgi:hypothetical protein